MDDTLIDFKRVMTRVHLPKERRNWKLEMRWVSETTESRKSDKGREAVKQVTDSKKRSRDAVSKREVK